MGGGTHQLTWQGGSFADQEAMATHEYARKDKNGGHQAYEGPKDFSERVESAEMKIREPGEDEISKAELIR